MSTTIRNILNNRPVYTAPKSTPLQEVSRMMEAHHVGAIAIVENDQLLGILTERDLVFRGMAKALAPESTPAADIMTPDPVTVQVDDAISDALAAKLGDMFRHLPVMEGDALVGILSYRDIPAEYVMLFERFREMSTAHADD